MTKDKPRFEQNEQPQIPEFTLQRKYIELIKSGRKTVEGRINSGGFRNFKVGDQVRFFDGKNPDFDVICEVVGMGRYAGFKQMLEAEGVPRMIPDAESLNEAVAIYNRIPSYTERAKRNGVIALRIKVINPNDESATGTAEGDTDES